MSNTIPIKYNMVWTNIYILIGILCGVIFFIGGYLLNDVKIYIYVFIAIVPIYFGFKLKKRSYAVVSFNPISVYGLFGQVRHQYSLKSNEKFIVKNNRVYLKTNSKMIKIKMNNWFVNHQDWQNVLDLFSLNETEKITKHLIDDEI